MTKRDRYWSSIVITFQPLWNVLDGWQDGIGLDAFQQWRIGVMFAGADEQGAYTRLLRAANVVFDIVAYHHGFAGGDADGAQGLFKEGAVGLAQNGRLLARRGFQRADVCAAVQLQAIERAPVEVGMGCQQDRAVHQHAEGMVHGLVSEEFFRATGFYSSIQA